MAQITSPRISVIIPMYKVEKYIRQCIESVIGQTMTDIEIIAVNDGSPDRSAEIVREYAAKDSRIKLIDQPNGGLAAARNTGMNAATAPFVMFLDSDDWVMPDWCRMLHDAMTDDVDFAMCGVRLDYEPDVEVINPGDEEWFNRDVQTPKQCNSTVCSKIFRLEVIRDRAIEFPVGLIHEDEYFWNAYLPWCRAMTFVPDKLYVYRIRQDSIMGAYRTSGERKVNTARLYILALIGEYYQRNGLMNKDEWAGHFWYIFDRYTRAVQQSRAKRFRKGKLRRFFARLK